MTSQISLPHHCCRELFKKTSLPLLLSLKSIGYYLLSVVYSPNFCTWYLKHWLCWFMPPSLALALKHSSLMPCSLLDSPDRFSPACFSLYCSLFTEMPTPKTAHLRTLVYLSYLKAFLYNLRVDKVTVLKTNDKET